jgi:hypothetical protein
MLNPAAGQQGRGTDTRRLVGEQEPGEPERTERPITIHVWKPCGSGREGSTQLSADHRVDLMRVPPPLRSTPAQPAPVDDRPSEYGWFGSDDATTASLSPSDCTASPLSTWPPASTTCSHRKQSPSTSEAPVPTELGGPMSASVGKCCRSARRNHQCVNGQVALVVVPGAVDLDSGACGAEVTLSWLSTGGWTTGGRGWRRRRAQQPTRGWPG